MFCYPFNGDKKKIKNNKRLKKQTLKLKIQTRFEMTKKYKRLKKHTWNKKNKSKGNYVFNENFQQFFVYKLFTSFIIIFLFSFFKITSACIFSNFLFCFSLFFFWCVYLGIENNIYLLLYNVHYGWYALLLSHTNAI